MPSGQEFRDQLRKAQAALHKGQRNRRGRRPAGGLPDGPGMVRRPPPPEPEPKAEVDGDG